MASRQAGADSSDLPLPRAQEDAGEVSGTGAAEQPRGTTTRLRGIRRQRLPGREHGGAARGDLGGTTAHRSLGCPTEQGVRTGEGEETDNLRCGAERGKRDPPALTPWGRLSRSPLPAPRAPLGSALLNLRARSRRVSRRMPALHRAAQPDRSRTHRALPAPHPGTPGTAAQPGHPSIPCHPTYHPMSRDS